MMRNEGFRTIPTETETSLPGRERRCPRRLVLGWTHLIAIVSGSVLFAVLVTKKQPPCTSDHLNAHSINPFPYSAETTSVKLNVNNKIPDTLLKSGKFPKIAWLMSFPNSGTSFTSRMVRRMSRMSTATNYGEELLDRNGESIPVYANTTTGPFWIDPQSGEYEYDRPTIFAFTKTHCGGRCEKCGPSKYVENPHSFLRQCLTGKRVYESEGKMLQELVTYDVDLVQRAVHLIRSPFDNVVSRFHLELHGFSNANDTKKMAMYRSSREGFRTFCRHLNQVFEQEEKSSHLIGPQVWELMKDVPCRDDFFRFIQWHNLAWVTTQNLGIPTLVVHYENYDTKFNETVSEMLQFLHLESRGERPEFVKGKEYIEYFTPEERENVKQAMHMMALRATWDQISHYF